MPEITYPLVAPLVEEQDVSGHSVRVVFRCPVSHVQVRSSGEIREGGSAAGKQLKRSLWSNLRYSFSSILRGVFGYGIAGSIGSDLARGAVDSAMHQRDLPKEPQIQEATLDAFKNVQSQFAWDPTNERFVSASVFKELQTEFTVKVSETPIVKQWDRAMLVRMLAEVAAADGNIDGDERIFFASFSGDDMPSIDELAEKPPLTAADLGETSAEVREVMLMLAMALACSDEDYAASEQMTLRGFATSLSIDEARYAQLEQLAKDHIIDQMLETAYADGILHAEERAQVDGAAKKLRVATETVDRLDARCRKRKGIV